jgi:hypothetical protein
MKIFLVPLLLMIKLDLMEKLSLPKSDKLLDLLNPLGQISKTGQLVLSLVEEVPKLYTESVFPEPIPLLPLVKENPS